MRRYIDVQTLKKFVEEGKSYEEISKIMKFRESSLCRCYTKNFGVRKDRGASYRQRLTITREQEEIIFGSLLGDMCIAKHANNYRGLETHSVKQEAYIKYKQALLYPLCGVLLDAKTKIGDKIYNKKMFSIRPNLNLKKFYEMFYYRENHKKDVPKNLSLLTPRAIAFWFMDDGFHVSNSKKSLGFSTCSFSLEGLLRLQKYFSKVFKIDTIIRKNFYLIIRANSYETFCNLVKPYIIPSMLYKLGI